MVNSFHPGIYILSSETWENVIHSTAGIHLETISLLMNSAQAKTSTWRDMEGIMDAEIRTYWELVSSGGVTMCFKIALLESYCMYRVKHFFFKVATSTSGPLLLISVLFHRSA